MFQSIDYSQRAGNFIQRVYLKILKCRELEMLSRTVKTFRLKKSNDLLISTGYNQNGQFVRILAVRYSHQRIHFLFYLM